MTDSVTDRNSSNNTPAKKSGGEAFDPAGSAESETLVVPESTQLSDTVTEPDSAAANSAEAHSAAGAAQSLETTPEEPMQIGPIQEKRAPDSDRRSSDRRRSARGLFEILARRAQVDRRRLDRRGTQGRFRLAFWRRPDTD